uniref:Protein similar n=5 Tax=Bactrocera latifrons TaxID=174628 RepID=A0A0K8VYE3_BACLA
MLMDEDSLDQAPSPTLSAQSPSLIKPLHCETSTAALLRNYRHNPMIGGPGVLPSPPFGPASSGDNSIGSSSCEVSPPGLTPADSESNSDSGIDDISMIEAASPIKLQLEQPSSPLFKISTNGCSATTKDMLLMKCLNNKAAKQRALLVEAQAKQQQKTTPAGNGIGSSGESKTNKPAGGRKGSLTSYIDNMNPLMEPFIMDLCNDDYAVATEPLLEPTEIDHVLNNWSHEMA